MAATNAGSNCRHSGGRPCRLAPGLGPWRAEHCHWKRISWQLWPRGSIAQGLSGCWRWVGRQERIGFGRVWVGNCLAWLAPWRRFGWSLCWPALRRYPQAIAWLGPRCWAASRIPGWRISCAGLGWSLGGRRPACCRYSAISGKPRMAPYCSIWRFNLRPWRCVRLPWRGLLWVWRHGPSLPCAPVWLSWPKIFMGSWQPKQWTFWHACPKVSPRCGGWADLLSIPKWPNAYNAGFPLLHWCSWCMGAAAG